jgi:hypothetical protein
MKTRSTASSLLGKYALLNSVGYVQLKVQTLVRLLLQVMFGRDFNCWGKKGQPDQRSIAGSAAIYRSLSKVSVSSRNALSGEARRKTRRSLMITGSAWNELLGVASGKAEMAFYRSSASCLVCSN